ncbi:MAG: hybrid sensor histidine kinase/response regulator [Campylobacterales bacterium]|nr:hybrid sensor histidine kinase/response regulator [Campylobacterales bacterium]
MKNITILAVDDIEANLISLEYLIEEYMNDVNLLLAPSGEEALKLTYTKDIDIIILDIQMPGMDGFETAKYLKSSPKTKDIPIIFLTAAFKEEEFQQKGFEVGAIDYLTKPIENRQFINKLNLYIQVIIKTKELQSLNDDLSQSLEQEILLKEKIQEQQLELVEQSKISALGEMIGNIAHQWRQPLSVISTCASGLRLNLELGLDNKEVVSSSLARIVDTTSELSSTIESFRNFTFQDKLSEFNLSAIINKTIENEKYILDENNIKMIIELDDEINLNNLPNSLIQALQNIIKNSKEALNIIKSKKLIFINTFIKDNAVHIQIKDNAGGIEKEHIGKIYEPYFTTKHQANGIGLGLNITYKLICDSMRGKIKTQNIDYDYENKTYKGALTNITLPFSL